MENAGIFLMVTTATIDLFIVLFYPNVQALLAILPLRHRSTIPWGELSPRVLVVRRSGAQCISNPGIRAGRRENVSLHGVKVKLAYRHARSIRWDTRRESAWLEIKGQGFSGSRVIRVRFFCTQEGLEIRTYHAVVPFITIAALLALTLAKPIATLPTLLMLWIVHEVSAYQIRPYAKAFLESVQRTARMSTRTNENGSVR
jgi:hypothetical protein